MTSPLIPRRITDSFVVEEIPTPDTRPWPLNMLPQRPTVRLYVPIEYRVGDAESDEIITAPRGFETDFASVPWGAWNLFPPLGPYARPAIIHDLLYRTRGTCVVEGVRYATRPTDYTRKEADRIFLEAMEVVGVPKWKRLIMYHAVRLGGAKGWGS